MNSEGKDEEGKVTAEQKTESKSEGQSVTKTPVTMTRDQIEQIQDQCQQIKIMTEENLVKNNDLTSKSTNRHPLPSFDDLRPQDRVKASDVWASLNKPLFGKFYLCQTIGPAMDMDMDMDMRAIVVSVTDPQTDYDDDDRVGEMRLALYNYSSLQQQSGLKLNLEFILPLGSYLVLRNPLLKKNAQGSLIWHSENPAEVELVSRRRVRSKFPDLAFNFWSETDEDETAFDKLKWFGNAGFVGKRFSDAIRFYNMAFDYCSENGEDEAIIESNKSAALLALGCFNAALKCAEAALEVDPGNEKYNYRKTKALIGLRKYEEAASFLEEKFELFSSLDKSKDCKKLLETVKFLSSRKNLGPTESQLISFHLNNVEDYDKIPEFTGPVEISQIEGKGRGLIATQDIRPGQLLICAKAFSYQTSPPTSKFPVFDAAMAQSNQLSLGIGNNSVADKPHKEEAIKAIAHKLLFEPELGSEFYNLTAGTDLGHLEPGNPKTRHVDMKRIKEILKINAFDSDRTREEEKVKIGEFTRLWILPSFFDHSCSEHNAVWAIRGEWMTVKAVAEVKKGEELMLYYKSPIIDYELRHNYFTSLGFTCTCKLCQLEASEPTSVKIERAKILKSLAELATKSGRREIKMALNAVEKLVSPRKHNVALNFPLLSPQIAQLAETLFCNGHLVDAISLLSAMFVVVNASRWHDGIYVATSILACHAMRRDKKLVKIWIATIKRLEMKLHGGFGMELFRIKGSKEAITIEFIQEQFGIDFFQDD